jgi:hypothetical protein
MEQYVLPLDSAVSARGIVFVALLITNALKGDGQESANFCRLKKLAIATHAADPACSVVCGGDTGTRAMRVQLTATTAVRDSVGATRGVKNHAFVLIGKRLDGSEREASPAQNMT